MQPTRAELLDHVETGGMTCPYCKSLELSREATVSRSVYGSIYEQNECQGCGLSWTAEYELSACHIARQK